MQSLDRKIDLIQVLAKNISQPTVVGIVLRTLLA